jgi:Ni,Fe-hydrogenase III small subunit
MIQLKTYRLRLAQGSPYIRDLRAARPEGLRGRPVIGGTDCAPDCSACSAICPTHAIDRSSLAIDLGRCVFCDRCVEVCPEKRIEFTSDPRLAADERNGLVVRPADDAQLRVRASETFAKLFGRSLKLRQVSAGGCNACELELGALTNVNFDLQRFGIEWVSSPRHADALVLTGPLTRAMQEAVQLAWDAMPEPRFLVAVGACAISGGLYEHAAGVQRGFVERIGPALFVPGCPPHPLSFIHAIVDLLDKP